MEVVQHGHLLVKRDAHVVLHRVQRSQHQVENANGVSASRRQEGGHEDGAIVNDAQGDKNSRRVKQVVTDQVSLYVEGSL